ncbi:uncharacterized protein [Pyrus communis]|uniref:uncharacterized protein n=1 Tax=Pyrus communis TaxID=23211 RepID=UPI0035C05CDA
MAIISPRGSNKFLLSRLGALIKQQRLVHALSEGGLQAQVHPKMVPDWVPDQGFIDMSKWKKVNARVLGIKPSMISQPSWIVLKLLQAEGFEAYLVGGCVRDLILKRVPKDFDVITTANLKEIKKKFHRADIVGQRFPICRVHVKGTVIEVSSFETVARDAGKNKEKDSLSCRPPGCDKKDFIRWKNSMHRDFTINSLFFDPFTNKIYDYANGITDLRQLKLRTLGSAKLSFEEDCARILRGLRIAARLSLSFSKETETAMHKLSSSILSLSKSRIMMEMDYMLSYGAAEASLCLLWRFDLIRVLFPFHAAYFDQQSKNLKGIQSSTMLMKLFSNMDKVVSCDRPGHCSLWVGLLAFHLALVNNPQDALVVLTFASVLYHEEWEEGVKFSRENVASIVNYVPEISGSCEFKSEEELAKQVSQLASVVLDYIAALTATKDPDESMSRYPVFPFSGLVFLSKNMAKQVAAIVEVLANDIEYYNQGRKNFEIDCHSLGKGHMREIRFVLGKVILETMDSGILRGKEVVQENEDDYRLQPESVDKNFTKDRKRGRTTDTPELKEDLSKKHKVKEALDPDIAIDNQEVVETTQLPQKELISVLGNILEKKKCQLPEEVIGKKRELSENDKHDKFQNKQKKNIKKRNSSQEETLNPENMLEQRRYPVTRKVIREKITELRQETDEERSSPPPLSSHFSSGVEEIRKRKQVAEKPISGGLCAGKRGQQQIRQTRRAFGVINQSLSGAPAYPCVVNKRPFLQTHEVYEKKQADPAHRPITRKSAAQISTQQSCFKEVKISKVPNTTATATNSTGFGDCTSIFVDDEFKSPEEQAEAMPEDAEPMFLEQAEPEPEEANDAEEVEMVDIVEEPIVDIDGSDLKNPLAVVDYVEDLYAYYRRTEGFSCVPPDYMGQHCDINEKMRAILIDWLIEVQDKFELLKETLFLTVNLIDRFLSRRTVVRKKLQLVGLVAMLLACKYEEVSAPIVGDLILISDKAYTRQEVLEMENLMLNTLQFNMSVATPYVFMSRFLKAAQSDNKIELLSFFLIELSLVEYQMLKFPPSLLAAAAVYTAQCTLSGFKQWSRTCEWHTNYSEEQLL